MEIVRRNQKRFENKPKMTLEEQDAEYLRTRNLDFYRCPD